MPSRITADRSSSSATSSKSAPSGVSNAFASSHATTDTPILVALAAIAVRRAGTKPRPGQNQVNTKTKSGGTTASDIHTLVARRNWPKSWSRLLSSPTRNNKAIMPNCASTSIWPVMKGVRIPACASAAETSRPRAMNPIIPGNARRPRNAREGTDRIVTAPRISISVP